MKNKSLKLILFLLLAVILSAQSYKITTVYLVRHAEKEVNKSRNPKLTTEGKKRAQLLSSIFTNVDLSAIYSTDYIRTVNTVEPIAKQKNISITSYHPFKPDDMIREIQNIHTGKSVLISGHSNTLSKTISDLGGEKIPDLNEKDYSNLFILIIVQKGDKITTKLQTLTY